MSDFDLILRNGSVVTPDGAHPQEVGVRDGVIVAIADSIGGTAAEELDLTGLFVFPGAIDVHVHLNEPGRADWEGILTGTRALAAGGASSFFDMPLNSSPALLNVEALAAKRALCEEKSICDFALWGGLTPVNLAELPALSAEGVIGFKAFMSASGTSDFPRADTASLYEGMRIAADLGRVVAVHAENDSIVSHLAKMAVGEGRLSMRDYLASRPVVAELEAVQRVILLAWETGCAVHFVHVSTGRAVQMITSAREQGADLTCETCPHYLLLDEEDAVRIGAAAKCAPPLRAAWDRAGLWARLLAGEVDLVASDHSPAPPDLKLGEDFFRIWGGISGAQHTLPLVLSETAVEGHFIPLERLAALLAQNPARRFGLTRRKGAIEVGLEADFAIVAQSDGRVITRDALHYRHRQTAYLGRRVRAEVVRTILRGRTIAMNGEFPVPPAGRMLCPEVAA